MAKLSVQPGAVIDGFTIGQCVHSGGMATLWSVTRPDIAVPLLMKIPRVSEGEDPAAIVSFEMEQMILPRLSGPYVPACYATGDFARQAYVVIEPIPGKTLYSRLGDLPLGYEEARGIAGKIALALADLHRQNVNRGLTQPRAKADLAAQLASCPIVAIAVDTAEGSGALNDALRVTVERILATLPSARLACLNVLKLGRVTIDRTLDEEGKNKHVDRLVALRHWASPLRLDESRLSVHVLGLAARAGQRKREAG
jgi:hypothetical protein